MGAGGDASTSGLWSNRLAWLQHNRLAGLRRPPGCRMKLFNWLAMPLTAPANPASHSHQLELPPPPGRSPGGQPTYGSQGPTHTLLVLLTSAPKPVPA